ncbi:N-terminal glutamine amidase-domain-containing protein [Roridomyces roridus]|uniref:Protein N-terminal glutamine amidohydrolase n=1 Tax=Roridomyces roridus TaxID=1738132 RepID=A0AAD7BW99_9AGAR|nr:N-terminal glutamine amidase-domain-containing protein [Roridomyces roridus]
MSLSIPTTIYTPYYCEENVYLACEAMASEDVSAVFISNHEKTVALWNQKLSQDPQFPVFWDYHCVLLFRGPEQFYIYDLDTRLPCPCPLKDYLNQTFRQDIPESFHRFARSSR